MKHPIPDAGPKRARPERRAARHVLASVVAILLLGSATNAHAQENAASAPLPAPRAPESTPSPDDRIDPLIRRLDALGITDANPGSESGDSSETGSSAEPHRPADVELHLVSTPVGLGLLATRSFEGRFGAQRGLCRAPCTTWLDPGSYRFVVESRRGRDRDVPGLLTVMNDGRLDLSIVSRRGARAGLWTAALAMIGGGVALFFDQRKPVPNDDITCITNCFHHTTRQRALQTVGGITAMFGGIVIRYAVGMRDVGVIHYQPVRLRTHATDEAETRDDP